MRPSLVGLGLVALAGLASTLLVSYDQLGVEWLFLGPGLAGTVEIIVSYFRDGTGSPATKDADLPLAGSPTSSLDRIEP
jgi:hypothetical protein